MGFEGLDLIRLMYNKKNDSFYTTVIVQHPDSDHRIDTFAHVEGIEHLVSGIVRSDFDICMPYDSIKISDETSDRIIGSPLEENVTSTSYKNLPKGIFKDNVKKAILLLNDKMREDKIVIRDEEMVIIDEYVSDKYFLGYHLRSEDDRQIKVMIPSEFIKKKKHLLSTVQMAVPVDIYAIPIINKSFFQMEGE